MAWGNDNELGRCRSYVGFCERRRLKGGQMLDESVRYVYWN